MFWQAVLPQSSIPKRMPEKSSRPFASDSRHRPASCASPREIMPAPRLPIVFAVFHRASHAPRCPCGIRNADLDCGGKRSATPLSHARKSFASSLFLVCPKAPSPLPLCRRSPNRHSTPFDCFQGNLSLVTPAATEEIFLTACLLYSNCSVGFGGRILPAELEKNACKDSAGEIISPCSQQTKT
jgi:hypothetical protein